jgi:hypothetical protein
VSKNSKKTKKTELEDSGLVDGDPVYVPREPVLVNIDDGHHLQRMNRAQRRAMASVQRRRKRAVAKGKTPPPTSIVLNDPNAIPPGGRRI